MSWKLENNYKNMTEILGMDMRNNRANLDN